MPDAFPYLVPKGTDVRWEPIQLWSDGWTDAQEEVPDWDPSIDLRIRTGVRCDMEQVESATGVSRKDLQLAISWSSSTSQFRGRAKPVPLNEGGSALLEFTIDGAKVCGTLDIRTSLVVHPRGAAIPGAATRPGSVLQSRTQRITLEGRAGMFPTQIIDFTHTPFPPEVSWHLQTSSDLSSPFLQEFRLLVNSRDRELVAAIAAAKPDDRQQLIIEDLHQAVATELVELAVMQREDLIATPIWAAESVGDVLRGILHRSGTETAPGWPVEAHGHSLWRSQISAAARAIGPGRQFQ